MIYMGKVEKKRKVVVLLENTVGALRQSGVKQLPRLVQLDDDDGVSLPQALLFAAKCYSLGLSDSPVNDLREILETLDDFSLIAIAYDLGYSGPVFDRLETKSFLEALGKELFVQGVMSDVVKCASSDASATEDEKQIPHSLDNNMWV